MNRDTFLDHVSTNEHTMALLDRLPQVGLPDVWLVSGCLFQTVWNALTGRPPDHGVRDYDVFYFDADDLSWEAEDRSIERASTALQDLNLPIEIRNQARVHVWYAAKFGMPYPPLTSGEDGIGRFLATACMVGLQPRTNGEPFLCAPAGLKDLADMVMRPNQTPSFNQKNYWQKANRWKAFWPELTVLDP